MEFIHAETYEDACREISRLKERAGDTIPVYRIVKSRYHGFDVIAIDPELYVDMMSAHWVDGLPTAEVFRERILIDEGA